MPDHGRKYFEHEQAPIKVHAIACCRESLGQSGDACLDSDQCLAT